MNGYGAIILAAVVGEFVLEVVADVLNLRALDPEPPPEFRDVFDRERYRRAQEYTRVRTRFGIVVASVNLALLLGFWFLHGFAALDRWLRAFGLGPLATGLAFFAVLGVGRALVAIPFRWWSTFVIEERFGFNRTTARTFWLDLAKGTLLAVALGGPLAAAILWFFEATGNHAWLWCWLAATVFTVGAQFVFPRWIMPLFNEFRPLADGGLREAILSYARGVGFPLDGVFVIDGSRRSSKGNALFTGFGRHKRIALFDTLLGTLDGDEVVAVVAHEVGHYKRHHVVTGLALGVVQMGVVFFLLSVFLTDRRLFDAFYMDAPSVYAGLVFFGLLFSPIEAVLSVALHALSRRHEVEADRFAVETIGSGERLASALVRLSADALANLTPHWLYVVLHYSHPPVVTRIRALRGAGRGVPQPIGVIR